MNPRRYAKSASCCLFLLRIMAECPENRRRNWAADYKVHLVFDTLSTDPLRKGNGSWQEADLALYVLADLLWKPCSVNH